MRKSAGKSKSTKSNREPELEYTCLSHDARKSGYPHLVQRLSYRTMPEYTEGRPVGVGSYFGFDYMGSAEFEFGAIPSAKTRLVGSLNDKYGDVWPDPVCITAEGPHKAWFVGLPDQLDLARDWFSTELKYDYTFMKERSRLRQSYLTPKDCTVEGWWCIDDYAPFALFKTQVQAKDFILGLRGQRRA